MKRKGKQIGRTTKKRKPPDAQNKPKTRSNVAFTAGFILAKKKFKKNEKKLRKNLDVPKIARIFALSNKQ